MVKDSDFDQSERLSAGHTGRDSREGGALPVREEFLDDAHVHSLLVGRLIHLHGADDDLLQPALVHDVLHVVLGETLL